MIGVVICSSVSRTTDQPPRNASMCFVASAMKSGCAIVPTTAFDEHAALDLEDRFARDVREV